MEKQKLQQLQGHNVDEIKLVLEEFVLKNADLFDFERLRNNNEWIEIWSSVFKVLENENMKVLWPLCLNAIRILSRDEQSLKTHDISIQVDRLLQLAQLAQAEHEAAMLFERKQETTLSASSSGKESLSRKPSHATEIMAESLKCLCNLVYQSSDCRRKCSRNALSSILRRAVSGNNHPYAVELYDMKLLFLLTALDADARNKVQIDHMGVAYMTELLDEKICDIKSVPAAEVQQLEVLTELLKVLFNITTSFDRSPNENEIQNLHLTNVIREVILHFGRMKNEREYNIISHCINLLTNISGSCYIELTPKCEKDGAGVDLLFYEDHNVKVLDIFIKYLRRVLDEHENTASSGDLIPPVLTVLIKCARGHRFMRHYIRGIILPPLKDFSERPEVGNELRNHLIRFLTLPTTMLRDLSGELLFVCCKENVERMVKYTGFGNAAGLFAARGLLDCRRVENTEYSSDSEDSDTEEYKKMQDKINPVLGCYEAPKSNPFEGMSEEQKEYEAVQLANLMDKLHRTGVIQPCRVGEDGKPVPVEHILELQEELPQQQQQQKNKN